MLKELKALILGICLVTVLVSSANANTWDRPYRWCGWYMRQHVSHDPGTAYNLARNWLNFGRATRPVPGAIVVWRNHVGKLIQQLSESVWVVNSGNDSHAVRTRPRSIVSAIGFRIDTGFSKTYSWDRHRSHRYRTAQR